jgi:hypothetical protein
MGMIKIQMYGSFKTKNFETCAEEGGHVQAIKRAIECLTSELSAAVIKDAELTQKGIAPPTSPLGTDLR